MVKSECQNISLTTKEMISDFTVHRFVSWVNSVLRQFLPYESKDAQLPRIVDFLSMRLPTVETRTHERLVAHRKSGVNLYEKRSEARFSLYFIIIPLHFVSHRYIWNAVSRLSLGLYYNRLLRERRQTDGFLLHMISSP